MTVTLHCIISTLPNPDEVIVLLNSETPEKCAWSEKVRDEYLKVRELAMESAKDSGLDPNYLSVKILPFYARIIHPTGRIRTLFRPSRTNMKITDPAGNPGEPGGLNLVLIHKAPGETDWRDSFVTSCSGKGFGDFDSLETRSNRRFIQTVAEFEKPAASNLKLVAVPGDENIRLTRNKFGEYVTQVAKVWS